MGKFALSHTYSSTPLPGLHIQGIGVIGFPLSDSNAKLIEAVATQAPFGNAPRFLPIFHLYTRRLLDKPRYPNPPKLPTTSYPTHPIPNPFLPVPFVSVS